MCSNLASRFLGHNTGGNKSTVHRRPFVVIHVELFESKKEALAREREVKMFDGGVALKQKLIAYGVLNQESKLNV